MYALSDRDISPSKRKIYHISLNKSTQISLEISSEKYHLTFSMYAMSDKEI